MADAILSLLRVATGTFRRRLLLAVVLASVVAIPTYAMIISNSSLHTVTIQDVTITTSPASGSSSFYPSGSTQTETVTVSTPQTFTGKLTISITNTTGTLSTINPASFSVTINSATVTGVPGGSTIAYFGPSMTISNGTTISYTVSFLSKAEAGGTVNGIQSGTTYAISQLVSQSQ